MERKCLSLLYDNGLNLYGGLIMDWLKTFVNNAYFIFYSWVFVHHSRGSRICCISSLDFYIVLFKSLLMVVAIVTLVRLCNYGNLFLDYLGRLQEIWLSLSKLMMVFIYILFAGQLFQWPFLKGILVVNWFWFVRSLLWIFLSLDRLFKGCLNLF